MLLQHSGNEYTLPTRNSEEPEKTLFIIFKISKRHFYHVNAYILKMFI